MTEMKYIRKKRLLGLFISLLGILAACVLFRILCIGVTSETSEPTEIIKEVPVVKEAPVGE